MMSYLGGSKYRGVQHCVYMVYKKHANSNIDHCQVLVLGMQK
jgi:hypothetical protein